jgi:hypothetical protein
MPSGKAYLSRVVLYEKVGDGPVRCHWCRRSLRWLPKGQQRGIEADHLDGDTTNDDPSNLVASCARCNSNRGKGILWFTLQAVPGADMGEVYRWGPLKAEFPCGHPFTFENIMRTKRREHVCLDCHRQRGRDYWKNRRAGTEAPALPSPRATHGSR